MAKLIFECAIFSFILVQILSLSAFTNKDDNMVAVSVQSATIHVYGGQPSTPEKNPFDEFKNIEPVSDMTPQEFAQAEADRIIREGDLDSFQQQLDANPAARFLLGL